MDKFLKGFRDSILLMCFTAMLVYGKFNIIFIVIISTIVGMILFVTPEERNEIKEIFDGFKASRIKKATRRDNKV